LDFRRQRAAGAWLVACVLAAAASVPFFASQRAARQNDTRLARLSVALSQPGALGGGLEPGLSLRVSRLEGVLAKKP